MCGSRHKPPDEPPAPTFSLIEDRKWLHQFVFDTLNHPHLSLLLIFQQPANTQCQTKHQFLWQMTSVMTITPLNCSWSQSIIASVMRLKQTNNRILHVKMSPLPQLSTVVSGEHGKRWSLWHIPSKPVFLYICQRKESVDCGSNILHELTTATSLTWGMVSCVINTMSIGRITTVYFSSFLAITQKMNHWSNGFNFHIGKHLQIEKNQHTLMWMASIQTSCLFHSRTLKTNIDISFENLDLKSCTKTGWIHRCMTDHTSTTPTVHITTELKFLWAFFVCKFLCCLASPK